MSEESADKSTFSKLVQIGIVVKDMDKTIEYLDKRVVKTIVEETAKMQEPVAIAILPDHPTPCEKRTHSMDSVPFMIYHPGTPADNVKEYNEKSA